MMNRIAILLKATLAALLAFSVTGVAALADVTDVPVHVKDIARVQGVTGNQLVGYGVVVGLQGTGDSTSVIFTSQTIQNILQSFGLNTALQSVRTRDVAAVIVTATLPPFAHSGDNVDVTVSMMGDATTLQGGTLVLTELKAANNLVYATAQGPISVGGFVAGANGSGVAQNFTGAGRIPGGAIIARDMITPLQTDQSGFNYVLTTPDYRTAANLANVLNQHFGSVATAIDAETVHVALPSRYHGQTVMFLADADDLTLEENETAKVVLNERTGTVVFGGDIRLAPCAIAHGDLTITISTQNAVSQPNALASGTTARTSNSQVSTTQKGHALQFFGGKTSLNQVVTALNTLGVSPRDLISIVQALREAGAMQADVEVI